MEMDFQDDLKYYKLREMVERADNAVGVAVAATAATGAIPIPFADMPLLIGEQVAMMATICGIFEIDIKKDGLKATAGTGENFGQGPSNLRQYILEQDLLEKPLQRIL